MADMRSTDSVTAWSQYWSAGRLSSCPGAADNNYSGVIAAAWETLFSTIAAPAELLDIACGNGALLALAQEHARAQGKRWQLTGVDLAAVAPAAGLSDAGISLQHGIDMHALPFADHSFVLVCSQFGIEYGHFPDNLTEALRVLKPKGRFQFLLHCADSAIARRAELQLQQIDLLLEQWALFGLLQQMLHDESEPQRFQLAKQRFDHAAASAFAYLKANRSQHDVSLIEQSLQQLGGIWQSRGQQSSADALQACADAAVAVASLRQRLLDQQAAVLDQAQAGSWQQLARQLVGHAELSRLQERGRALAWCLTGINQTQSAS